MHRIRLSALLLTAGVAVLALALAPGRAAADYTFPNAPKPNGQAATYLMNLTDIGEILGSTGAANLPPTYTDVTHDELVGVQQFTSIHRGAGGPELITAGTNIVGMFGDLVLAKHVRPNGAGGYTTINDITPTTGPLVFNDGDILYFSAAGRNPLLNPGDAGAGGYLLASDNKTGFAFDGTGNGAAENPQGLTLGTGGFAVAANGTVVGNDNYSNAPGQTAIDPNHILLAGKLESFANINGLVPPSGFPVSGATILGNAPAGAVFAEVGTTPVGAPGSTATRSVGFGYLDAVAGSSVGSFADDVNFSNANTVGAVPLGGPTDLVFTIQSQLNFTAPSDYSQFQSSSNDPVNYVGGVPEPASFVLGSIGLLSLGLAGLRRRLRKLRQAAE